MRNRLIAAILCCGWLACSFAVAQDSGTASAIVTAVPTKKEAFTPPAKQTITVLVDKKPHPVTGWTPYQGARAGLQLVILMDNSSVTGIGIQLQDIKNFINSQPPTTQIAVAYMENGAANIEQNFTANHAAAAQALHDPAGFPGSNGSPYFCLQDLLKKWPANKGVRREVIMVSSGDDRYSGNNFDPNNNPYLQAVIKQAQQGGVIIYSIYFRNQGLLDRSGGGVTLNGQDDLLQLSQETGGVTYDEGFGNPVSFQPFMEDIGARLQSQFELTFSVPPSKKLVPIKLKTSAPGTALQYPSSVPVVISSAE